MENDSEVLGRVQARWMDGRRLTARVALVQSIRDPSSAKSNPLTTTDQIDRSIDATLSSLLQPRCPLLSRPRCRCTNTRHYE